MKKSVIFASICLVGVLRAVGSSMESYILTEFTTRLVHTKETIIFACSEKGKIKHFFQNKCEFVI